MSTTVEDLKRWFEEGKKQGATHMIVVCDTFEYEDYPVYVMPSDGFWDIYGEYNGKNMQRVMEVYNLSRSWDVPQACHSIGRCWDVPKQTEAT